MDEMYPVPVAADRGVTVCAVKVLFVSSECYPLVKTGGLADVIATLPLDQRTVVVLRFWADLDHRAIGDAMHLRPSSVRSLLTRALTRLRKDIEP